MRTCRMQKYFVDLYQASLKDKVMEFDFHSINNALVDAHVEINNALILDDSITLSDIKTLDVSNFIKDQNDKELKFHLRPK